MYLLTETVSPFALERWAAFFANFGQFAKGFLYTLGISIGALIVALLLGLIFGAMSSTRNKVLRGISRVYVEIFQNTPLLVQFVVVFYGISILTDGNVMIPTSLTAILCVGVYTGAYISEIIRTGIEAVPKGQTEAALSQGFTYADTMRIIILPQAVRTILPPLTNQVVNLIKNTSTVAIISGAATSHLVSSCDHTAVFHSTYRNFIPDVYLNSCVLRISHFLTDHIRKFLLILESGNQLTGSGCICKLWILKYVGRSRCIYFHIFFLTRT